MITFNTLVEKEAVVLVNDYQWINSKEGAELVLRDGNYSESRASMYRMSTGKFVIEFTSIMQGVKTQRYQVDSEESAIGYAACFEPHNILCQDILKKILALPENAGL